MRPLKKTDIPDIIEISKTTWNGHDHLPNIIGDWIQKISCHPYVLELDGRVIGVASIRIIDCGMTGWLEGLRIHEEARNQGLARRMTEHLFDAAKQLRVQRIRLVRSLSSDAPGKLAESIGMKPIYSWSVFWKDIHQVDWEYIDNPMTEIEPDEVKDKLKEFPNLISMPDDPNPYSQSIIRYWDVYEVSDENLKEIGQHAKYHFGIVDGEAAFSIGGIEPSSYGPEWCFTLCATSSDAFLKGMYMNYKLARENGSNNLMCIHQPEYYHLYDSIEWLHERNHELNLILHERYLHQE